MPGQRGICPLISAEPGDVGSVYAPDSEQTEPLFSMGPSDGYGPLVHFHLTIIHSDLPDRWGTDLYPSVFSGQDRVSADTCLLTFAAP